MLKIGLFIRLLRARFNQMAGTCVMDILLFRISMGENMAHNGVVVPHSGA